MPPQGAPTTHTPAEPTRSKATADGNASFRGSLDRADLRKLRRNRRRYGQPLEREKG